MSESSFEINLISATIQDYPIIQNLAHFYVYDISRYCGHLPGWQCPEDGLFKSADFKKYFIEENHFPFIVRVNKELAGFVLIDKIGSIPSVDWHIDEFFILAKFQRQGIGQKVAEKIWSQFRGHWELSVIPQNTRALSFWRQVIGEYTQHAFREILKPVSWDKVNPRIFFYFTS